LLRSTRIWRGWVWLWPGGGALLRSTRIWRGWVWLLAWPGGPRKGRRPEPQHGRNNGARRADRLRPEPGRPGPTGRDGRLARPGRAGWFQLAVGPVG